MMKLFLVISVFPVLLLSSSETLFKLKRTTNSNEVLYQFNHTNCIPDAKNPIHPFWIMRTKNGRKEELTDMEKKRAYGVIIKSITENEVLFSLKAVPDRVLTVKCTAKKPVALILINGKLSTLKNVFVKIKKGGIIPSVESISLKGYDLITYETVEEVIQK